ncbi:MAG: magnesium transporter [Paracoccaceae bacterium]|nr:magnesium transporter [Paracoccaceae bacterium]
MQGERDIIQPDQARQDNAYTLDRRTTAEVLCHVGGQDRAQLINILGPLHAADIADLLEQISAYDRKRLVLLYDREFDGEILAELEEGVREDIIAVLKPEVLAEAVRELDSGDVVDILEDLEQPQQDVILDALDKTERAAVKKTLTYPEFSAGRLMQREVVIAHQTWSVGEAIDYLRTADKLPDQFHHVTLVDGRMHPIFNVTLGRLMSSARNMSLKDIKEDIFWTIPVLQDEEDVAYAFNQYHLIASPVVDESGRIVGVITIDDAMVVLNDEHEEDILRLAGVGESSLSDSVLETTLQRFPWLAINLVTAILASVVIAQFEATIEQLIALAVLMPIVASMGGNAGTQSLTVVVRSLATKDLINANVYRVIWCEVLIGLVNGAVFAVLMGIVGLLWFGSLDLCYVIGMAMIVNLVIAGFAGTGVPVLLDRIWIDPALASGAFVTTLTDIVGFFAFLGLAAVILF